MTRSFGAGDWDFLVLKLASDGSLSWARTFGGMGQEDLDFVCQTSDNGYFATGYTSSFGVGWDILVLKLASDGSLTWARRFGGGQH